jgi:hypothetical protein
VSDELGLPATDEPGGAYANAPEEVTASDLLRIYLNQMGRYKLLTAVQEVDLAKAIEAGLFAQTLVKEKRVNLGLGSGSGAVSERRRPIIMPIGLICIGLVLVVSGGRCRYNG